jgi:hypothetical protein
VPSPFPGMDPFLEEPEIWPAVHANLIVSIQDVLVPRLRPHYYVAVEQRVYDAAPGELHLVGVGDVRVSRERPSARLPSGQPASTSNGRPLGGSTNVLTVELPTTVEVKERYLEIRRPRTHELITVVEVLSPTNKRSSKGREQYERKRLDLAGTLTNLVEVDLLRAGDPLPLRHQGAALPRDLAGDYRVVVSRGSQQHRADLYAIGLRDPLPVIPTPLRPGDEEPTIDLQAILNTVYDRGGFDLQVDYRQAPPPPPLSPENASWTDALLRAQHLR